MSRYIVTGIVVAVLTVVAFTAVTAHDSSEQELELERLYGELEDTYREIIDTREELGQLGSDEADHARHMLAHHSRDMLEYMEYCVEEGHVQRGYRGGRMGPVGAGGAACH